MSGLSVIIIAKNEEDTILSCIRSVGFADEIILIDDYSTDRTPEVAAKEGAKIYRRALAGDFSEQRNFALSKSRGDWNLFIDADEIVSKDLAHEIEQVILSTEYVGFFIPRITVFNGRKMHFGEFLQFSLLRLAKKDCGKWEGKVHEHWIVDGKVGKLHFPLRHNLGGVGEFLAKINYYSSLRASELFKEDKRSNYFVILFFPSVKFFVNYILKLGFLDGIPGVINAIGMSFYTFLVKGKLWLLWNETTKKA